MITMYKCYSDLIKIPTFEERIEYLKLSGSIGIETFGFNRYLNQSLYHSAEWQKMRNEIIARDNGWDLAFKDRIIPGRVMIHHINPLREEDLVNRSQLIFDPENLISCSIDTHNRIHYGGNDNCDLPMYVERKPNDTCPWKKG